MPTFGWRRDERKVGDKKGYGMKTMPSELVQDDDTPFDVVWTAIGGEETIQSWVHETNFRAQRYFDSGRNMEEEEKERENDHSPGDGDNPKKQTLYGRVWSPLPFSELMMWFAICFMMVIIGLSNESDYWTVTAIGLYPAFNFKKITNMSYRRFRQIKRFFNCKAIRPDDIQNDRTQPRFGKTKDKLHRNRPFIDTLNRLATAMCIPGLKWSIDESIIPYFGMFCPIKVYMKDKPHKFGMKVWGLWDAVSSYCLQFHVYEGRGDKFDGETEEWASFWNLGERVILAFVKFIPAGSFIFTDRFFTTPRVAAYLRDIYSCYLTGTLMKNTKGVDKENIFKKSRHVARGFFKWSYDTVSKIIQVCWLDRNPVLMLSSMISAMKVGGLQRLTWNSEKGYHRKDMQCPEMAREYNQEGMGGGDSNDRMKLARRTSCELNLVSKRWDWRLFWGLMDIAITNAFILYSFFHPRITHSQFFFDVANDFFLYAKKGGRVGSKRRLSRRRGKSDSEESDQQNTKEEVEEGAVPTGTHKRVHFKGTYKRSCFVCLNKRQNYTVGKNPKKDTGKRRENFPRSHSGCKECNVALCNTPECWRIMHTE